MQNLLDIGLADMAAARLGWWFDHYLTADGQISTGDWEDSCPNKFADGLSDYGEMEDLFVRCARMQLATNGTAWLGAHITQGIALMNYSYSLRMAAVARHEVPGRNVTAGMIWGSPEHDLCHSPGYYYHNNAWFIRGMLEAGKFLRDVCGTVSVCRQYSSFGSVLLAEAARFQADFNASLGLAVTRDPKTGAVVFIPPLAQLGFAPFKSMIESTIAEYSNFRFYSELLGADILSDALSNALQDFRESTTGTVSGITRWSDHLDDMPSSYYLATSLRNDRVDRFLLLHYGHMANYMGRGTFTATEQLPITADANGQWRDYLWSYLEGGIDMCVPSVMLPAIATRWQLVLERYDEDVIYLARGAPRRWFNTTTGGFSVRDAATRFGAVSVAVTNAPVAAGEHSTATTQFTPWPNTVPGITSAPSFALRLRASDSSLAMDPASVTVFGAGARLTGVNATMSTIFIALTGGATSFVAQADFK